MGLRVVGGRPSSAVRPFSFWRTVLLVTCAGPCAHGHHTAHPWDRAGRGQLALDGFDAGFSLLGLRARRSRRVPAQPWRPRRPRRGSRASAGLRSPVREREGGGGSLEKQQNKIPARRERLRTRKRLSVRLYVLNAISCASCATLAQPRTHIPCDGSAWRPSDTFP